jgi:anti-anti-sigma factor
MLEERAYALTLHAQGPYAVVRAEGELDVAAVPELGACVLEARDRTARVVVDLRPVTFMDTFALRALIALQSKAGTGTHWTLHVLPGEAIQRVLDLARARDRLQWISAEQLAD